MKNIIKKCLIRCEDLKAACIAFPALGAGNLKFPIAVVAKVMITTVARYLKSNQGTTSINTVKLVIYMEDDFQEFQRVFKLLQLQGDNSQKVSSANSAGVLSSPTKPLTPNDGATIPYQSTIVKTFVEGSITVEIVLGDISDDDSDAIVSPTNKEMDLAAGEVSAAILEKGGPEMQLICDSVTSNGYHLKTGELYVTTATENLRCKSIFHVVVSSNNLGNMISICLEQAEANQLASIAFPALGTGATNYSVESAADLMYVAITTFALCDPIHVKTVRIVLYQQSMLSCYSSVFTQPHSSMVLPIQNTQKVQKISELKPRKSLIARARNALTSHLSKKVTGSAISSTGANLGVSVPVVTKHSELILQVFADETIKLDNTEACLQLLIEEQLVVDNIDDRLVCKLNSSQQAEIKQKANTRNVEITMELGKLQHNIQLKGDSKDVVELKTEICTILTEIDVEESKLKDILSVQAKVKWQWENPSGDTEDYDPVVNHAIEQAYQSNKSQLFVYQDIQGLREEFDFQQMKAKDLKAQSVYNIKRLSVDHSKKYLATNSIIFIIYT